MQTDRKNIGKLIYLDLNVRHHCRHPAGDRKRLIDVTELWVSVKDLKSVYAMNNSDEVTFIDEIDLMFYIDIAFGGVKDYNGKGIIWQLMPTLNSLYFDRLEQ